MIPKIIHYCWFGQNPLPESAKKCIESWKIFFPDYEIREWNEDNFDVNTIPYTAEAYKLKKYAFVSDYARFWILYKYGGIYFDTDVEMIKPMNDLIAKGAFMGREQGNPMKVSDSLNINPGLGIGAPVAHPLYKIILNEYRQKHFVSWDGRITETVVTILSDLLKNSVMKKMDSGILLCQSIMIYPPEYFCPLNYYTGQIHITEETRTIHHYNASWKSQSVSLIKRIQKRLKYMLIRFCLI